MCEKIPFLKASFSKDELKFQKKIVYLFYNKKYLGLS